MSYKKENSIVRIEDKTFKKFLNESEIKRIVKKLAVKLNRDFKNKKPIFLIVLNGSIFFGADLLREIKLDCSLKTISAKSYGDNMTSSGYVEIKESEFDIEGKDIIVIEDIVDSGYTLAKLKELLETKKPASIKIVTLLSKPSRRQIDVKIDYIGREIPDKFVIGYGLDFAEKGRNLPDIFALEKE